MNRLIEMWKDFRRPPVVEIARWGERTNRPQVGVSVVSRHGAQSVYTWDADDVGEAKATLYGKGLAEIIKRRLVDRRLTMSTAHIHGNKS